MATHRRAWIQRAGVVLTLAAGALFALPAPPASATAPNITEVSASPNPVEAGKTTTVTYRLEFASPTAANVELSSSDPSKLQCVDGCSIDDTRNPGPHTALFQAAPNLTSDATVTITIKATAGDSESSKPVDKSVDIALVGRPQEKPTVKSISGRVTNSSTGDPVEGALVMIRDSENRTYTDTTDRNGRYRFEGSERNPIAPGRIQIGATKDDTQSRIVSIDVAAGQDYQQNLALDLPAPTPSASPSESAEPTPSEIPSETPSDIASLPQSDDSKEDGTNWGSILLILIGGLLVALGVGAIVLLLIKRKENDDTDENEEDADAEQPARQARVPGSRGTYGGLDDARLDDPTRVVSGDPAPTAVVSPGLADAPTAMLDRRALADEEFPDPYGAPLPPPRPSSGYDGGQSRWAGYDGPSSQGGYGPGAGGAYGNRPTSDGGVYGSRSSSASYGDGPGDRYSGSGSGYGGAPSAGPDRYGPEYGDRPSGYDDRYDEPTSRYSDPSRYDEPSGRYSDPNQYDEPTSRYGQGRYGEPVDRYDEPTSRYGDRYDAPTSPYDARGYDQPGYGPSGGYDRDSGYGPDTRHGQGGYSDPGGYSGGGYGPPGYDERDGHRGYDQPGGTYGRSGYEQPGGYGESGYDRVPDQRGYPAYDQGNYYGGGQQDPRHSPQPRSERERRLGWLDD